MSDKEISEATQNGAAGKANSESELLTKACSLGILDKLAEEYILSCHAEISEAKEDENDGIKPGSTDKTKAKRNSSKSKASKFPNLAGFCRFLGIGRGKYERFSTKYPDEFEKISAMLEDEALNSEISPSLLTAYLKKRLGYGESSDDSESKTTVDTAQLKLIFDHDIFADGD